MMLVSVVLGALVLVLLVVVALLACSPGRPAPVLDADGTPPPRGVCEKTFVTIGGVRQGMFLRGRDSANPLLLFLHGGPCFPTFFMSEKFPSGLEDHFTVCYWEERGGGLSYGPEVTLASMTLDQLTSDALEVAEYLRARFGQERIYLMAHSGGTMIGLLAAARAPQLFHAYIGMAQITHQRESEKLAYRFMLERYAESGNAKRLAELKSFPILDDESQVIPFYKSVLRDEAMHELGVGTMRAMTSVLRDIVLAVMLCRAYTLREKFAIWVSKFSFVRKSRLIDEQFAFDFPAEVPRLELPVYLLSGAYDLTVNRDLSRTYLDRLVAPRKGFYTFPNSAHSPLFEEPGRMLEILVHDVLGGTTSLADPEHATGHRGAPVTASACTSTDR